MKKETHFGKIARLPDTTPEAPIKPKEEPVPANKRLSTDQANAHKESGFSGELNIRIPKSLHAQLNEEASKEGVSLAQYVIYKLAL